MEGNQEKNMTSAEALEITFNLLGEISLPVKYENEILTIKDARKNLQIIAGMIEKEKQALLSEKEGVKDADHHDEEGQA